MTKQLNELLSSEVQILNAENSDQIELVTVEEITEGFDFYITHENGVFYLIDVQDENEKSPLGSTVKETLHDLQTYTEYFNDLDDLEEPWESNFLYSLNV